MIGDNGLQDIIDESASVKVVTDEMIDAGIDCFWDLPELLGSSEDDLRETLRLAYLRMRSIQIEQRRSRSTRDAED